MAGFTKLFSDILDSTVWDLDSDTRIVWVAMLAMADAKGRVMASVPGLAHRARVKRESVDRALAAFLGPDPDSRTADHDGRRIEKIDGGWILLNYQKYREKRDQDEWRAYQAAWVREKRASKNVDQCRSNVDQCRSNVDRGRSGSIKAEAEAEEYIASTNTQSMYVNQSKDAQSVKSAPKGARLPAGPFLKFWDAYPKKVGKQAAFRAWERMKPDLNVALDAIKAQRETDQWQREGGRFIPNPATWINQGRWEDSTLTLSKPKSTRDMILDAISGKEG